MVTDCVRECRAIGFGRLSNSASEAACGFKAGVEELSDRISSFGGDLGDPAAESFDTETMLAGGKRSSLISGSSGIVSLDNGRAALPELTVEVGVVDLMLWDVVGLDAEDVEVEGRAFGGLIGVIREDAVVGLLGGAEAAPPNVVRLLLSVLGSGLGVRELVVPTVGVLTGRLFSSPCAGTPSSLPLPAGFLTDEVTGRVGGLLMVLPAVREDTALVREDVGDATVLEAVSLEDVVVLGFFGSSVGAFRRSILLSYTSRHRFRVYSLLVVVLVYVATAFTRANKVGTRECFKLD